MAIYKYKITIENNKNFLREYEIKDNATLYDFHRCIQNDLDFDEAQLAMFFLSSCNWEKLKPVPLFDLGDGSMDSIEMTDLIAENENYLLYVFDIYNNRELHIELMHEVEQIRATYPRIVLSKGNPPNQFSEKNEVAEIDDYENDNSGFESDEISLLSETNDV